MYRYVVYAGTLFKVDTQSAVLRCLSIMQRFLSDIFTYFTVNLLFSVTFQLLSAVFLRWLPLDGDTVILQCRRTYCGVCPRDPSGGCRRCVTVGTDLHLCSCSALFFWKLPKRHGKKAKKLPEISKTITHLNHLVWWTSSLLCGGFVCVDVWLVDPSFRSFLNPFLHCMIL